MISPPKKSWTNTRLSGGSARFVSEPGQEAREAAPELKHRATCCEVPGGAGPARRGPSLWDQKEAPVPPTPGALPRPHLPSPTCRAEGAGAGSLRQRVASREESLCHTEAAARGERGRRWVGADWRRGVLVCQSLGRSVRVPPQSPRPPRSRSMRPARSGSSPDAPPPPPPRVRWLHFLFL